MNAIPPVLATTEALTHIFALLTRLNHLWKETQIIRQYQT